MIILNKTRAGNDVRIGSGLKGMKLGWKKANNAAVSIILISLAVGTVGLYAYLNFTHRYGENCAFKIPDTMRPPKTTCVVLEKAESEALRVQGLSDRKNMAPTQGMLFVFDQSAKQCMWMKDMHLSLDIIWLNERGKIVSIKKNVGPETYPETFCTDGKFVVEVLAGTADKAGLFTGQYLPL